MAQFEHQARRAVGDIAPHLQGGVAGVAWLGPASGFEIAIVDAAGSNLMLRTQESISAAQAIACWTPQMAVVVVNGTPVVRLLAHLILATIPTALLLAGHVCVARKSRALVAAEMGQTYKLPPRAVNDSGLQELRTLLGTLRPDTHHSLEEAVARAFNIAQWPNSISSCPRTNGQNGV